VVKFVDRRGYSSPVFIPAGVSREPLATDSGMVPGIARRIASASLHISSSIYFHHWMPGVYSSPVLLIAAGFLLAAAREFSASPDS